MHNGRVANIFWNCVFMVVKKDGTTFASHKGIRLSGAWSGLHRPGSVVRQAAIFPLHLGYGFYPTSCFPFWCFSPLQHGAYPVAPHYANSLVKAMWIGYTDKRDNQPRKICSTMLVGYWLAKQACFGHKVLSFPYGYRYP